MSFFIFYSSRKCVRIQKYIACLLSVWHWGYIDERHEQVASLVFVFCLVKQLINKQVNKVIAYDDRHNNKH